MIYLLYGEEEFLLHEALASLRAGLGPGDMLDLNTVRLDGASVSFGEFESAVVTIPFLADCRLVMAEGLLARFERAAGGGGGDGEDGEAPRPAVSGRRAKLDAGWERFGDLMGRLPETTQLVFIEGKVGTANPLLKALTGKAELQAFRKLRGAALSDWVRDRAAHHRCRLSPPGVRMLLDLAGDNLRVLDGELVKLALYAGGEPVDVEDVRRLVAQTGETTVFALVDACAEHKLGPAQRELHKLLEGGAAPTYILFMLARQIRLLLQARELLARRAPQQEMKQQLGIFIDWVFDKTLKQAQGSTTPVLVRTMERLLESDVQMKTGGLEPVLSLELLVTELCGTPARREGSMR